MERIPTLTIHDLSERELMILRQEVESRKKSTAATWLLWVFLGFAGAHRFYLGRIGTGVAMLLTIGGLLIWALVDAFLIPGMLRDNERKVQAEILEELAALRQRQGAPQVQVLTCFRCGVPNPIGVRFCGSCGASLSR